MNGPFMIDSIGRWPEAADRAAALLKFPETRMALDHWVSIGDAINPPSRWRLDPIAMAKSLPKVFLMALDGDTLTYVLAGDDVSAKYNYELRGKTLEDIVDPEAYPGVAAYFLKCVKQPAIMLLSGRLFQERDQPGFGERLLLPLFEEGEEMFQFGTRTTGLLGVTVQKREFVDQRAAYRKSRRILYTVPLDGTDVIVEER